VHTVQNPHGKKIYKNEELVVSQTTMYVYETEKYTIREQNNQNRQEKSCKRPLIAASN